MKSDDPGPGRDEHDSSTKDERRPVWPLFFLVGGAALTVGWVAFLVWLPLNWLSIL
jgi:hypothetical protein